jgi:hypothetical protein
MELRPSLILFFFGGFGHRPKIKAQARIWAQENLNSNQSLSSDFSTDENLKTK